MPKHDRDSVLQALNGRFQQAYESLGADLRPYGAELRGVCPIHGGDGPNFVVYPDSGNWHCYSQCQEGGDIIAFVERVRGCDFCEALEWLADFAGMARSAPVGRDVKRNPPARASREVRPKANLPANIEEIVAGYHRQLLAGSELLGFLIERRGLSRETIDLYQLGEIPAGPYKRLLIPVRNADGRLVNARKHLLAYRPELTDDERRRLTKTLPWVSNLPDESKSLFPLLVPPLAERILITEGELDAILGNQVLASARIAVLTGTGGAGAWRAEWTSVIASKPVILLYDADNAGRNGAQKVAQILARAQVDVRIARIPQGCGKDLTDWVVDYRATVADILAVIDGAEPYAPAADKGGAAAALPAVEYGYRDALDVAADAYRALVGRNDPPDIFRRAGALVRAATDERGAARIEPVGRSILMHRLMNTCRFVFVGPQKRRSTEPPEYVMSYIQGVPAWPGIPHLVSLSSVPVLLPGGEITWERRYYPQASHLYAGTPLDLPQSEPTALSVAAAKSVLLDDFLGDFPFLDDASRAHALALLLQPFMRLVIDGPTPIYAADAPAAGTGKSLLIHVILEIQGPGATTVVSAPTEEGEWQKLLVAVLRAGASALVLDNVRRLDSPSLFSAITAQTWSGRLLGTNETVSLPVRLAWAATCNNIAGNDELTRRAVWIRLDAGMESPDLRGDFRHENLIAWARENRARLVAAALTLVRAWCAAGMPSYSRKNSPLGSFEDWSRVIGGILETVGVPSFLDNTQALRERADRDTASWQSFVAAWREQFGDGDVCAQDLLHLALLHLSARIDATDERAQKTRLGRLLGHNRDRVYAGWKIVSPGRGTSGTCRGVALYRLQPASSRRGSRPTSPDSEDSEVAEVIDYARARVGKSDADDYRGLTRGAAGETSATSVGQIVEERL